MTQDSPQKKKAYLPSTLILIRNAVFLLFTMILFPMEGRVFKTLACWGRLCLAKQSKLFLSFTQNSVSAFLWTPVDRVWVSATKGHCGASPPDTTNRLSPWAPEGVWPCQHHDLGLLASWTMREQIPIVHSNLLQQAQETNTPGLQVKKKNKTKTKTNPFQHLRKKRLSVYLRK